jgi:hypothetical protein
MTALVLTGQTCTAFTCAYVQALYAQREHSLARTSDLLNTTSDSVANGAHELVPESHHSIVAVAIVHPHIPLSLFVIATETLNGRNNYAAIMLLYLAFRFCHHSSLRHSESSSSKCGNLSHSSKDLFHSLICSSDVPTFEQ